MKELKGLISISDELVENIYSNSFSEQNKFKIEDKVTLGLLISIIEKSKSVKILYENKHYAGIDIILRSIFEASIILKFILSKHTKDRALAYYLSIQLKEVEVAETITSESDLGKTIQRYLKGFGYSPIFEFLSEEERINLIKEDFEKLTTSTKSEKWLKIQNKKNTKNGKKEKISSFRGLCEFLGEDILAEYEIMYRMLSQEVHAKDIKVYYEEIDGYLQLSKRNESEMIISLCKSIIIESSKSVAKKYNYSKFYKEKMNLMVVQRNLNKR